MQGLGFPLGFRAWDLGFRVCGDRVILITSMPKIKTLQYEHHMTLRRLS